jgi:predicted  nucleic acid-binding Zn-ribbon protein
MNKTLLLIMCDFMLLNLLALTRWEKAEPSHTQLESAAPRSAANAPAINADMVELMRVSLEDEKNSREALASQLSSTQGTLTEKEKNLAALQQQKGQLEGALSATQNSAKELEKRYSAASQDAFLSKEQLAKLQRELEERRAEAERQQAELARAERQNAEARQRIENLNVAVRVAEQEKQLISQNLVEAKQQVEVERMERVKVQEQTTQLTAGVSQLAEKSGALSQEIRENRPINPNIIFSEFLANRVQTSLTARRPGLFSPTVKDKAAQTILVSDGIRVYALMHLSDTPFTLSEVPTDYDQISGHLSRGSFSAPIAELQFLRLDPRVIVAPIDASLASLMGAKIYQLAKEPFKFPDAVLVRADDGRYGDTPFRIDQSNSNYVKLDNRISTRLFGEIAPKRGDLVFSKTGDLIGLMVNSDYCAVLGNFTAAFTLKTGETPEPKTSAILGDVQTRWSRLPIKLQ